jgi:SAM-dependent methyltransferase
VAHPVAEHYGRGDLLDRVLQALRDSGYDPDDLDPEALAPAEEFHTLGRAATVALAEAAGVGPDDHVLDVGSGLGGPARLLARRYGARVTGVDLTPELCEVAADLTRRVGLDDRVEIHQGDALDLPFDDASFDVVWTQHVSMNIADKPRLFAEMCRVLRPSGRLAFFDILAGPVQPIHFPVPWAEDESVSALATPAETRAIVEGLGLQVRVWEDVTAEAIAFYEGLAAGPPEPAPLGLHLVVPNLPTKGANLTRNAVEERIVLQRCVADAP